MTEPTIPDWLRHTTHNELEQGDIVQNIAVGRTLSLLESSGKTKSKVDLGKPALISAMFMNQSCDLMPDKLDSGRLRSVLMARVLFEGVEFAPTFSNTKWDKSIKEDELLSFGLPAWEEQGVPRIIVDFSDLFLISVEDALLYAQQPRLRMNPPYRQMLSQCFARSFMRVEFPGTAAQDSRRPRSS